MFFFKVIYMMRCIWYYLLNFKLQQDLLSRRKMGRNQYAGSSNSSMDWNKLKENGIWNSLQHWSSFALFKITWSILYLLKKLDQLLLYFVCVDDILITWNDLNSINHTKVVLHKIFKVKDLGELRYFLGIEFARLEKGIVMHQRKYSLKIISETGLSTAKPASTPLVPNIKLPTKEYDNVANNNNDDPLLTDIGKYRRLIGKLLYLTVTRPDI